MRKIVKQAIDCQLAAFSTAGYPPAAVLLSRDKYTELLQELAYDSATDDINPIAEYDGILVVIALGEKIVSVVPNAEQHWNNDAEIDDINAPVERRAPVRFTDL
jgi:hypothetical protein